MALCRTYVAVRSGRTGFKMSGSAVGDVSEHDRLGRFTEGNSEYRAKQRRLAEIAQSLAAEFDPTPSQVRLLAIIARHMDDAERSRSAERRVKASNAVRRLLKDLKRKPEPPLSSLEGYLEAKAARGVAK
jgi:hypothetical protein